MAEFHAHGNIRQWINDVLAGLEHRHYSQSITLCSAQSSAIMHDSMLIFDH